MDQDDDIYRTIIAPFFEILIRIKNRYTIINMEINFNFRFIRYFPIFIVCQRRVIFELGFFVEKGRKKRKKQNSIPIFLSLRQSSKG